MEFACPPNYTVLSRLSTFLGVNVSVSGSVSLQFVLYQANSSRVQPRTAASESFFHMLVTIFPSQRFELLPGIFLAS